MKSIDCLKHLLLGMLHFAYDIVADEYFLLDNLLFHLGDRFSLKLLSLRYQFIFALHDFFKVCLQLVNEIEYFTLIATIITDPLGLSRATEICNSLISLSLPNLNFNFIDLIVEILQHPKRRCQLRYLLIVFKFSDKGNLLLLIYEVCLTNSHLSSSIIVFQRRQAATIIVKNDISELFLIAEEYFEVLRRAHLHLEQAKHQYLLVLSVANRRVSRAPLMRFRRAQAKLRSC